MKFYDETKPLYTETDTSEAGLGAAMLQTSYSGMECQTTAYSDPLHLLAKPDQHGK